MDVVALSKFQFAMTVFYHFLFVPLSIGLGLTMALAELRYYKSGDEKDLAASNFWIKVFTATFAVGVATGITMEFAFGTNWANYSRFVGDIFGAPLAAEAIFAFFLESTFLAILLFGRNRVSKKFFMVSAWLVWCGSLLSALWILIANSWMQTPAGYEIVQTEAGSKAVLTDFFAAALNHTTVQRYFHVIVAIGIVGGFCTMAIAAYNYLHKKNHHFARTTMKVGIAIALISSLLMLPAAHMMALAVANNQPSKLAAIEGHWETGPMAMSILGWINTKTETTHALAIPGAIGLLTNLDPKTPFTGLNDIAPADRPPLQVVFQSYRFMVLLYGVILLTILYAWWLNRKGTIAEQRWFLKFLLWMPLIPMLAIQLGWIVTEMGRQPWIVWGELRTADAVSAVVPAGQVLFTIIMFLIIYTAIYFAWARIVLHHIKRGPVLPDGTPLAELATEGEGESC